MEAIGIRAAGPQPEVAPNHELRRSARVALIAGWWGCPPVRRGRGSRWIERHRGDRKAGRKSAGMEPSIPYGDDERLVRQRERTRKVHGIGAPQRKPFRKISSVTADRRRQLHRPGCPPELGPALFCLLEAMSVEVMVTVRGSERCTDFGIGQPARHRRVAAVPQSDC